MYIVKDAGVTDLVDCITVERIGFTKEYTAALKRIDAFIPVSELNAEQKICVERYLRFLAVEYKYHGPLKSALKDLKLQQQSIYC